MNQKYITGPNVITVPNSGPRGNDNLSDPLKKNGNNLFQNPGNFGGRINNINEPALSGRNHRVVFEYCQQ